jgi:pimeloyl-ACP methyl ester carboxylesterase
MAITTETWQHRDIISSGPLIVLLHGFPEFWYSWRYQIPFLAEHGFTVVAPDLRGYNDSDKPRKGYDVPTLLRDIEGLIKGLGQEQAIIVGHDWGGVLAWAFALI